MLASKYMNKDANEPKTVKGVRVNRLILFCILSSISITVFSLTDYQGFPEVGDIRLIFAVCWGSPVLYVQLSVNKSVEFSDMTPGQSFAYGSSVLFRLGLPAMFFSTLWGSFLSEFAK